MRTDGATAENMKHLKFSVPTGFGPSTHLGSSNGLIFQGKATRTDGGTAANVKHLEFSVPTGFVPQNLILSELRNRCGSDLHLRASAVRMV